MKLYSEAKIKIFQYITTDCAKNIPSPANVRIYQTSAFTKPLLSPSSGRPLWLAPNVMIGKSHDLMCPLLGTLMVEPVLLPTSKMVVDRCVIAKHLLSDPIDPFNRQPLQMSEVIPQTDLKSKIETWKTEQIAAMKKDGNPD